MQNLYHFIKKHKGNRRCEAKVLCFRRAQGTVIAIPEDENGDEIERVGMLSCSKHRLGAEIAAREYAEGVERKHKEAKK